MLNSLGALQGKFRNMTKIATSKTGHKKLLSLQPMNIKSSLGGNGRSKV